MFWNRKFCVNFILNISEKGAIGSTGSHVQYIRVSHSSLDMLCSIVKEVKTNLFYIMNIGRKLYSAVFLFVRVLHQKRIDYTHKLNVEHFFTDGKSIFGKKILKRIFIHFKLRTFKVFCIKLNKTLRPNEKGYWQKCFWKCHCC